MTRRTHRRSRGFTYLDLLAVVILVPVLVFASACWRRRHEGGSNRVQCASNLRQIGQAIMLYANENQGAYPRTVFVGGETVLPVVGTGIEAPNPFEEGGPQPNDVTAALFLLLRTQDIIAEVFVCPMSNGEKDDFGGGGKSALNRSNFSDLKKNLSYSYQNPYPSDDAVAKDWKLSVVLSSEYAIGADVNPGIAGDDDNVLKPTVTSDAKEMKQANSNNHEGDGQNVLYGDGRVEWAQTPFVGVQRDNIYTTASGKIHASPVDAKDSILLPTDD